MVRIADALKPKNFKKAIPERVRLAFFITYMELIHDEGFGSVAVGVPLEIGHRAKVEK